MIYDDNLVEYADPVVYDLENEDFEPDGPFYLSLARQAIGPVLELGCGTGRITIPLAEQGVDITGLDIVPGMLARAREKAEGLPIRWVEGDARTFDLGMRFSLIFESGGLFQHLLRRADQEAMLVQVREHLAPDGRFVISAVFPRPHLMCDVEEREWFSYLNENGQEVRVSGTQHYDHLSQVKLETAYRRWRDADGQDIVQTAPLALRLIFPQELEGLLHYNGFVVTERYGDWDASPLTSDSRVIVCMCRTHASAH